MPEIIEESAGCGVDDLPKVNPEEMAEIIFTSGSLGRAKGVMLSQRNLAANLMAMTKMINIREDDRFLMVLPIHHTYACTCGFPLPALCRRIGALRPVPEDRCGRPPAGSRDHSAGCAAPV